MACITPARSSGKLGLNTEVKGVIRSRVKSGSFNGMVSPTNIREFYMFKVKFIRAKSELNELF